MNRTLLIACGALALAVGWHGAALGQVPVQGGVGQPPGMEPPRFPDFNTVIRGAKEHDGFFKLYHKEDKVYCEIRPDQLEKPWLCSISVARGGGMGGHMLNFDEEWVLSFKRVGDRIFLIRRNVHHKANPGSPVAHAVETTYTDSVLLALHIVTINPMRQAPVINLNEIFMTDFAQLGMGFFDASRSTWHKVKAFPKNNELQVAATYGGGGRMGRFGGGGSIDSRGNTVVIHYGMVELPDGGYHPRVADDRVGYFLTAVKDYSSDSKDTSFVRYIRRWRIEPAEAFDPKNPKKLVAPKKKLVYWIEKSVPLEYRAYVREGILEWNKAFEKLGFRDVIEVRQQEDDMTGEFDPEDIRYHTFRWITSDSTYAMGPSKANPFTGELIDADIVFDASWLRYWKEENKHFSPSGIAIESPSRIRDAKLGYGLLQNPLIQRQLALEGWSDKPLSAADLYEVKMRAVQQGFCQCCAHTQYEMGMAAMALAARELLKPGEKVPEELIGQAIKEVTMHEVGHTLGLRHNFKASTMLKNDQLHDTKLTREKGLVGSVMDYSPVNLAPKGVKQGDYFTTTIGPYDYWAIEYGYKPVQGNEAEELAKIAAKGAEFGNDYGTDEDLYLAHDPLTNLYDLGADPMKFGQERMLLAEELLKTLHEKIVDKGEGYQRARVALGLLLRQYGDATYLTVQYVGGEFAHRDHKDDPKARDPLVPVKGAKQRECLKFLQDHILSDQAFQFSPQLLRRLGADRWNHWGSRMANTDYPLYDRILAIQTITLDHLLDPSVLRRIQTNGLKADKGEQPLLMAEVFRSLTDAVWSDPANGQPKDAGAKEGGAKEGAENGAKEGADKDKDAKDQQPKGLAPSVIRRNLQREHVKRLTTLVLGEKQETVNFGGFMFITGGGSPPPDARSLARMHLREILGRIDQALKDKQASADDTTRAHLEECRERIAKALSASMQIND